MGLKFLFLIYFISIGIANALKSSTPDTTFVDSSEYYLTSISPNRGPIDGGTRVTIKGSGFNVNFFTAGNYVYIGTTAKGWVQCDVIEGACSVKCGGPKTLICDTGAWDTAYKRTDSGWLNVKVMIESFSTAGANSMVELTLSSAFYYYGNCSASVRCKKIIKRLI